MNCPLLLVILSWLKVREGELAESARANIDQPHNNTNIIADIVNEMALVRRMVDGLYGLAV